MKIRNLLISYTLGLGLALALLWYVGGRSEPVVAGSQIAVSDLQPLTETGQSPDAPAVSLLVATNTPYWPMEYISGTQLVGHDIDLMNALTAEMGVTAVFTDVPFGGILDRLAAGEYDAVIAGLTVTPEREEMIDFTLPYVNIVNSEDLAIAVQQGNDALRSQFNDALRKLRDDGTLQTIVAAIAADVPGWQARLPDWAHCWTRINDDPAGYDSVQAAVDAASEGDTVKVAGHCTGVHVRPRNDITTTGVVTQVVYVSKTVTIQGGYTTTNWTTPNPEANPTTLDAQGQGRVLYITGDVSPTIEGLRISGGDATGLGGEPFWGHDAGGGVFVISATATIKDNQVFSNTAENGGGLFLHTCTAEVSENAIVENSSSGEGGGVGTWGSDAILDDNIISHNTSSWGGGLYLHSSNATLSNNTVSANAATGRGGGGLFLWWSNATLAGNRIGDNTSIWNTNGGLHVFSSAPVLTNNVIVGNQSGGMQVEGDAHPRLVHNTMTNNGTDGVGLYVTGYTDIFGTPMHSSVELTNTVLISHSVGISVTGGNTVTVNRILWHGTPVTVSQSITAVVTAQNEHTGDPAFAADGYHITPASAAMDAGADAGVTTDIDGHVRPYNAIPDLGADEIIATLVPTVTESTLAYTDTQALATTVQVPAGAVTETVTLAYTPVETATSPSGFAFAGRAFDLDAYQGGALLQGFTFSVPVTITIHYDEADLGGLDENSLVLKYWNGSAWIDAACGPYDRHPAEDWLAVPICHLSRFAVFGEQRKVFLPLVVRGY